MNTAQLAIEFMAAVTAADWLRLGEMHRDDAVTEYLNLFRMEGRKKCLSVYQADSNRYAGFVSEVVEVLMHDESRACIHGRVSGTEVAPLVTPRRTYESLGRSFAVDIMGTFHFVDGQVSRLVYAFNALAVFTQLGHIESL